MIDTLIQPTPISQDVIPASAPDQKLTLKPFDTAGFTADAAPLRAASWVVGGAKKFYGDKLAPLFQKFSKKKALVGDGGGASEPPPASVIEPVIQTSEALVEPPIEVPENIRAMVDSGDVSQIQQALIEARLLSLDQAVAVFNSVGRSASLDRQTAILTIDALSSVLERDRERGDVRIPQNSPQGERMRDMFNGLAENVFSSLPEQSQPSIMMRMRQLMTATSGLSYQGVGTAAQGFYEAAILNGGANILGYSLESIAHHPELWTGLITGKDHRVAHLIEQIGDSDRAVTVFQRLDSITQQFVDIAPAITAILSNPHVDLNYQLYASTVLPALKKAYGIKTQSEFSAVQPVMDLVGQKIAEFIRGTEDHRARALTSSLHEVTNSYPHNGMAEAFFPVQEAMLAQGARVFDALTDWSARNPTLYLRMPQILAENASEADVSLMVREAEYLERNHNPRDVISVVSAHLMQPDLPDDKAEFVYRQIAALGTSMKRMRGSQTELPSADGLLIVLRRAGELVTRTNTWESARQRTFKQNMNWAIGTLEGFSGDNSNVDMFIQGMRSTLEY